MLDESDTAVVKAWLTSALEKGAMGGRTKAGLAAYCRVSPQAVSGWFKTGRITKRNLSLAAAYFGHAPTFAAASTTRLHVQEPAKAYGAHRPRWPFKDITPERLAALPAPALARVEAALAQMIELVESTSRAPPTKSPRRA